jgi:hypothetical protein
LKYWNFDEHIYIAFSNMAIFPILILLIQVHRICLHLLMSSSISFFSYIEFLLHRSFTLLIKIISRYFNFMKLLIIEMVLISVHWVCILHLCWMCLWDLRSLLVEFLGSFVYKIMSCVNSDNLSSSFPIWIPLISFFCLIALARYSTILLIKSRECTCLPCS